MATNILPRRYFFGALAGAAAVPAVAQDNNDLTWATKLSPAVMSAVTQSAVGVANWLSTNHPQPLPGMSLGMPFNLLASFSQIAFGHLTEIGFDKHWDQHMQQYASTPVDTAALQRKMQTAGVISWSQNRWNSFARYVQNFDAPAHVKPFAATATRVRKDLLYLYNTFNKADAQVSHAAWTRPRPPIHRVGVSADQGSWEDASITGGVIMAVGWAIDTGGTIAGDTALGLALDTTAIAVGGIGAILIVGGFLAYSIINSPAPGVCSDNSTIACIQE